MKYLLLLAFIIATISFNGCGTTDSSSSPSSSSSEAVSSGSSSSEFTSNLGQPQNVYGYYGDNVYFAGIKIVGEWEFQDKIFIFNSDGTVVERNSSENIYTRLYAVSEDGNQLDFINRIIYRYQDENNPNCLHVDVEVYPEAGYTPVTYSDILCKQNN